MDIKFVETITAEDAAALSELLQDPIWRLCNLYEIKTKDKGFQQFTPTPEQCDVINDIHIYGVKRLLILKARQLGMSTVIDLIMVDMMIWTAAFSGVIVDQNQEKASIKLQNIIIAAFNSMPHWLRERFDVVKQNTMEFVLRHAPSSLQTTDEPKLSSIKAASSSRGGTHQMLHISEWGPIQHEDPPRSDEIMTGSIPSAELGIIAIETTWMGGKHGNLWELTDRAMTIKPEDFTAKDFKLYFFSWYVDPQYSLEGNMTQIPASVHEYFEECEQKLRERGKPHTFTPQQRLWYYKVALPMKDKRYYEYPTLIEECFKAPVPGAIFSKMMDEARGNRRMQVFTHSNSNPVFTFWDLGSPKNTRVTYVQFIGREIHIIDHDAEELTPTERYSHMMSKGYNYGGHFLPHDAEAEEKTGDNFQQTLSKAGFTMLRIIPRCRTIWPGINHVHELSIRFLWHLEKCAYLIECMELYRTKPSSVDGHMTEVIVQGEECHSVDTVRMLAEAMRGGMLNDYANAIIPELKRGGKNSARQKTASSGRYGSGRR